VTNIYGEKYACLYNYLGPVILSFYYVLRVCFVSRTSKGEKTILLHKNCVLIIFILFLQINFDS